MLLEDLVAVEPPTTTAAGARLLDTAEELFYGRGIGAVGVDLVADEADVTKRTLYQRFGSKDGLVAAYLQRRAHRWQSQVLAAVSQADDRAGRLDAVFTVGGQWRATNTRGCAFLNAWSELGSISGDRTGKVVAAEKEWMRDLFRAIVDDDETAEQVHLLYEGALVTGAVLSSPDSFATAARAARSLLARA